MINTTAYLRALALGLAVTTSTVGKLQAQTTIPTTHVLPSSAGDTSKPGFVWRMSQVSSGEPNLLAWAEDQLAGLHGDNLADPNVVGVALAPANPPNPSTAPITFEIPGVINLSKTEGTTKGNFRPDLQMPGLPGTTGGTDNSAAELLAYLDLPAGTITMGVNSDDGFRMTIGGATPVDRFGVNVGQFDGGRGAANSIFTVKVTQAGLYATRVLWENGGGDANIEVFTVGADGVTPILVNDAANGGIKAYRGVTAVAPAYAKRVAPAPGDVNVLALAPIHVDLVDGGTPIDKATVSLQVDGSSVSATINKATDTTSVDYQISNLTPFSSGPHTAALFYTEGATKFTNTWSFTVGKYVTLDPAWRVTAVDTTKPGFVWNYFANSDASNIGNSVARAEADLAFPVDAAGAPLANLADHTKVGVAVGAAAPPSPANAPVHFEIAGVINLSIGGSADNNGNFTPDLQMPGVPSTDGTTDGQAAEIITYLTLPVGAITMGVNSDDNFSTASGPNPTDAFGRVTLGTFDQSGGRGASDTLFVFNVLQAGTYPFRTVWENGAGGSNIELFTVKPGGVKVLVNDLARGGIPAYRAVTTASVPYVKAVTPSTLLLPRQVLNIGNTMSLLLADGANAVADSSVSLKINGKDIPLTKTRQGSLLNVTADVSQDLHLAGDSAVLKFNDSTGAYSRSQTWTLYNLVNLVLPATPVTGENFDSYQESTGPADTVPPGWVASNFTFHETPGWDLTDQSSDAFLNFVIITSDRAGMLEGSSLQNDMTQIVNGQPIADWTSGNVLWAASDGRLGGGIPQVQIAVSKPFDLSSATNPVLSFYSMLRISGNRTEGDSVEYSIDGGRTWLGAAYFGRTAVNLAADLDGSWDAVASLNTPGSIITVWNDPVLGSRGTKLGDAIGATVSATLSPYLVERDDTAKSRRIEAIRLPKASKQRDVRLRFCHVGSCGWYWGIDNIAFYDIGPAPTNPNWPSELGQTVSGFQDDFTGATRDPNWKPFGPGGDLYVQANGLLHVSVRSGDPNHLLYVVPGYNPTNQEVVARIRITAFATGDPSRGGIGVGVQTNGTDLSRGINLHFRDIAEGGVTGRHFMLLDDARSWGPAGLPTTWANNTWFWLRLRQEPNAAGGTNDVFAKAWPADGVTPEPDAWQLTWNYIPTRTARSGFAGITGSSIDGVGNFEVDYILIKAEGLPSITVNFDKNGPAVTVPQLFLTPLTGTNWRLGWFGAGALESATDLLGPWNPISGAASPRTIPIPSSGNRFYRVKQ